ncbi:MAG: D-alanyl-D-alanine carboxypeptidase family protein [Lachnospiraceae bacterium]
MLLQETDIEKEPLEELPLYAQSAVLMDGKSGRILYEKNGYDHMPNASTTKIMTCILAIESGRLEEEVTVSRYACSMPKVHLGMEITDTFRLKDLLYSLMLESHNDTAVAVAEHIGGTVEQFAVMMNEKAKELGCKNTYFITPNGLDKQDEIGIHGTTAAELASIMSYCIKNETFLEITQTPSYEFTNLEGTKSYHCNNHNAFLQMMDGALSGKTGFTGNAGYCYVGALTQDNRTFVVALLACGWPNNKNYKWADTKSLMNYGLNYYQYQDVFEYEKILPKLQVEEAIPEDNQLYGNAATELRIKPAALLVLKNEKEQVNVVYDIPLKIQAPIQKNQQVGSVTYYLEEEEIAKFPVYTEKSVEKVDFLWYKEYLLNLFFMKSQLYLRK